MKYEEAKLFIKYHALEGVAYTSRFGEYPNKIEVTKIVTALEVILENVKGSKFIERELAGWLFAINDQTQGNFNGAVAKGIELKIECDESDFFKINELTYAIFEQ